VKKPLSYSLSTKKHDDNPKEKNGFHMPVQKKSKMGLAQLTHLLKLSCRFDSLGFDHSSTLDEASLTVNNSNTQGERGYTICYASETD